MMAEMIANYPTPGKSTAAAAPIPARRLRGDLGHGCGSPKRGSNVVPAGNGSGYLNEVSPLTVRKSTSDDHREA